MWDDRGLSLFGLCGVGERRFLGSAFVLLPAALVCDVLDGYVARLNRAHRSRLGADLDSLADVISFGVAPAILGFTLGLRGGWDMLLLTYFVVCGVSRLARFNVTAEMLSDGDTGKVKYFEGTPIPTSIVLVTVLGLAFHLAFLEVTKPQPAVLYEVVKGFLTGSFNAGGRRAAPRREVARVVANTAVRASAYAAVTITALHIRPPLRRYACGMVESK